MRLIVGLGNPGEKYTFNWHNCGFMALEVFAQKNRMKINRTKFKGMWGTGTICGEKVILLRPHTYMNLSGESIRECMQFYKIPTQDTLIIYDDIDIEKGVIRYREKGGSGTHNGMRSIISCLGTEDFPRIRIGCGPVPEKWNLADYVLSDIQGDDRKIMFEAFEAACARAEKWIGDGR